MASNLTFEDKIGILDPKGLRPNPLNNEPYSDDYKKLAMVWSTYPAYSAADRVLSALENYQLVFVTSSTGSGKSVLIPKLALHYTNYNGRVVMTLPKRIITLSAAIFSAKVSDVKLGESIGYAYKGSDKSMYNDQNKIIYVTDGIFVMEYVRDPLLSKFNVVIIDEAHERRIQIDLILLFLRTLLQSGNRPDLKVIIMSATIDTDKYQKYFNSVDSTVIDIAGQPNHPIETHFMDKPVTSYMKEGLELIEDLIHQQIKKDMLFFITTSNEALQLCRSIRPQYPRVYCVEVYSDMDKNLKQYAESRDKYLELGNYDQKLVMATNVAESSLTIDGLVYVIDSGYELSSRFDPECYGQILEKKFVSKAQALQRRGRVGRTEPGVCYHLLTKQQFDGLADYPTPDILRQDITMDLIKIIQVSPNKTYAEGINMMNQLMDPPLRSHINATRNLFDLYNVVDDNGILTQVGIVATQFSSLPLNRILFLIYAFELQCAREASIIVAMTEFLNGRVTNLFYKSDTICESNCEKQAANLLLEKLIQKRGDHFTYLKIYQEFSKSTDQKSWARKYGVRLDTINNIERTANQYFYRILNLLRKPRLPNNKNTSIDTSIDTPMDIQSRISSTDTKTNLLNALKKSHQHLTASKLKPTYSKENITGKISRDSVLNQIYKKNEISKKKIIYDELSNINGKWEFRTVTIIS
ncbi:VVI8 helicase [Acanthamoeba polyphaga mimivirus]|nr:VVI8 helicase [Acanthamoeba polyphaga lentillevirus]UMZ07930.1 VVI8 helicase [Acanthamoeba polyphaga mimivirus]